MRDWIDEHFTLFRFALFLCCFGYWWLQYLILKPRGREFSAGIMAAWTQFSAGLLLDTQAVRLGFWKYREVDEFAVAGVPFDLHIDWALTWGFAIPWLYSRLRHRWPGRAFVVAFLFAWVAFTVIFDAVVAKHVLFRTHADPLWWMADALFLSVLFAIVLWTYHTILFPSANLSWTRWSCRIRSALYVGSLMCVFYVYLPRVVLSLTGGWNVAPLFALGDWRVLALALVPPFALGTWAILAFADQGLGTPIPLDPPHRLVTSGPYAYIRNPMQISGLMLSFLLVLYYPTKYMLLYAVDMALASAVLIHMQEGKQLQHMFGEEYVRYRNEVRNWLPRLRPYVPTMQTKLIHAA